MFFRDNPCLKLSSESIIPFYAGVNLMSRSESKEAVEFAKTISADALAAANWSQIDDHLRHDIIEAISYCTARALAGPNSTTIVAPINELGIHAVDAEDLDSYERWGRFTAQGPLFIIYFPSNIPLYIPDAAIDTAKRNRQTWVWLILLSPTQIMLIQANDQGVRTHGPVTRN